MSTPCTGQGLVDGTSDPVDGVKGRTSLVDEHLLFEKMKNFPRLKRLFFVFGLIFYSGFLLDRGVHILLTVYVKYSLPRYLNET